MLCFGCRHIQAISVPRTQTSRLSLPKCCKDSDLNEFKRHHRRFGHRIIYKNHINFDSIAIEIDMVFVRCSLLKFEQFLAQNSGLKTTRRNFLTVL